MSKGAEKEFSDPFVAAWEVVTAGRSWRIPDSYHKFSGADHAVSHPRPADYVLWCGRYSAFLEAKVSKSAMRFTPRSVLTPSQRDAIRDTAGSAMRYYLLFGNCYGAWVFDAHAIDLDAQISLAEEFAVDWYPHDKAHVTPGVHVMLS